MRITKRQLRRIIREATDTVGGLKFPPYTQDGSSLVWMAWDGYRSGADVEELYDDTMYRYGVGPDEVNLSHIDDWFDEGWRWGGHGQFRSFFFKNEETARAFYEAFNAPEQLARNRWRIRPDLNLLHCLEPPPSR